MSYFFSLKDKVAIITGSSRGIGKTIAKRFTELGAKVVISSRKIAACKEVESEIIDMGGNAVSFECNISDKSSCSGLVDFCIETYGALDVLVCNAASNPYYGRLEEIPDESFDKIMNNNEEYQYLNLIHRTIKHGIKSNGRRIFKYNF